MNKTISRMMKLSHSSQKSQASYLSRHRSEFRQEGRSTGTYQAQAIQTQYYGHSNPLIIENLNKRIKIKNIVILDINGRFIKNEPNKKSLEKLSLNTSHLSSGIYLLKIEFSNQDFILKKLLVE